MEIEGKRIKPENPKENLNKLKLGDLRLRNERKELNVDVVDKAQVKFKIGIINKFRKRRSKSFHKKNEIDDKPKKQVLSKEEDLTPQAISIKEKIKYFSGEYRKKQKNVEKIVPNKLRIPSLFTKDQLKKNEINNEKGTKKYSVNILDSKPTLQEDIKESKINNK